ncbi:NAD-dependent epimerase/dehydratase family protein [Agromyces subbeticus]|uniref:NAD-dependent epimerase/dehydratase family protein n=1 Tax=Agromyces subbeticus TaxID=293890 RepID=UPI0003B797FC|nr:NAD-dependent epimerase/dehydratase family protein [Agromyces subbeticus]
MTSTWIVGAGGLLGRAVATAVDRREGWHRVAIEPLPWGDESAFPDMARRGIRRLLQDRGPDEPWAVLWVAGAAVTATPQPELDGELDQFRRFLDIVGAEATAAKASTSGAVFYASSAGGVYSGSVHPPFVETSATAPISPYGRFKLAAERALETFTADYGVAGLSGRIANLYGPGQRLDKMQGLISHLARAQISPATVSIYVSLDTMRDYIYVEDCAELILDAVDRLRASQLPYAVKNLASGRAVTIADLIGQFRIILKRPPQVLLGTSAAAALQSHDLRIGSVFWPELDARTMTPLVVGIRATIDDILLGVQRGRPMPAPAAA